MATILRVRAGGPAMRIQGRAVVLALVLCPRAVVAAPEPPAPRALTPAEAAAEVVKAFQGKDAAGVEALARKDDPDPWLVVDALMVQGARAAAEAFATAAPRKDVEGLPAFVEGFTSAEPDLAARKAMALGNAALQEKRFADALAAFEGSPAEAMAFLRIRLAYGRGLALAGLGRSAEASERFGLTATDLETLGWLSRAAMALRECERHARALPDRAAALDPLRRLVALETARGDVPSIVGAWNHLGWSQGAVGQWDEAAKSHAQALDLATAKDERALMAGALSLLAWAEVHRGRTKEAQEAAGRGRAISEPLGLSGVTARCCEVEAMAYLAEGQLGKAEARLAEAVKAAGSAKDPGLLARLRTHLGTSRGDLGDHARALEELKPALEAFEAIDPTSGVSVTLTRARYAWNLAQAGRVADARPLAERAVRDAARGQPGVQGMARWAEGAVLDREGKPEEAVKALMAAGALLERSGERDDSLRIVAAIAEIRRVQGKLAEARGACDAALEGARRFPKGQALPAALAECARVRWAKGDAKAALPLATEARDAYDRMGHARGADAMGALIRELEAAIPR